VLRGVCVCVQLLVTFDPVLVEKVATLLYLIMEDNPSMPRLYLTGVFFFVLMYTGSNVLPVARFLKYTHLRQAFRSDEVSLRGLCVVNLNCHICCHSGAVVTDRAGVQPGPQPNPRSRTLVCSHTAVRSSSLVCRFNCLHFCNPCKYMDYYSFTDPRPRGWEAELSDPSRTVYRQCGHLSTIDRAQGRESAPVRDQHPNHQATRPLLPVCMSLTSHEWK